MKNVVIPFVAARGGLGRTGAILQVAADLARWDKRVLVIDLDVTSPAVTHPVASLLEKQKGAAEYLLSAEARHLHPLNELPPLLQANGLFDILPLGRPPEVVRLIGRGFTTGRIDRLMAPVRGMAYDFILVDMPPGFLSLAWSGTRALLSGAATVICVFGQDGSEHERFLDRLTDLFRRQRRPRVPPPVLAVNALAPSGSRVRGWTRHYESRSFYAVSVPRLSALESSDSTAWLDARFTGVYHELTMALVDLAKAAETVRSDLENVYEVAVRALSGANAQPPSVLKSKLESYLHPRTWLISGRHGAGKSALAEGYGHLHPQKYKETAERVMQQNLPEQAWHEFWLQRFKHVLEGNAGPLAHDQMPAYFLYDGLDKELAAGLGWVNTLKAIGGLISTWQYLRERHGPKYDTKILLLPGTVHALDLHVPPQSHRILEWTTYELLEMALRRAVDADENFARTLNVWNESRISKIDSWRHEDWSREQLEDVATLLFGPGGLETWRKVISPDGAMISELVPGEAAELLAMAVRRAARTRMKHSFLVPPPDLEATTQWYVQNRVRLLLGKVKDPGEVRKILTGRTNLQRYDPDDPLIMAMLNRGLVRWVDEPGGWLGIPPLVAQGLRIGH